ncbi:phytoene/squalene synthase family protein [Actinacidiphila sp. DG2A-62]|uniref:phytoene/squalene synthase family protein n=1 Tax=Actinacidiphila sp. DG2A-62 TaxID=3108821 RepID=UPI002DB776F6|nr:phytoene/squalene synthase family protein [Actinacidiphila sp. DG2A-62]MEC3998063.1 phytoene/squalene synthase family protein [Actinacidiphila sp. DG2A-62]
MTRHELDAAGIHDPRLRAAYVRCRALNARHGRTYFLATRLLPADRRPAVHALYGFARRADDIVDDLGRTAGPAAREAALRRLSDALSAELAASPAQPPTADRTPNPSEGRPRNEPGDPAGSRPDDPPEDPPEDPSNPPEDDPVVRALADTARRYAIDPAHFTDFLASMRADLSVSDYADFPALRRYMHGSAAVIGLQMLPVLGHVVPRPEAEPHAADLGVAFQMTNFLRDVGEDLDRGRVYLPADLLAAHGVDRARLEWSRATGRRDRRVTAALRDFAAATRGFYGRALPGIAMLDPVSRPCVRTAFVLYGGILAAVERDGWSVLHRRSAVPRRVRLSVALDGLARVGAARIRAARAERRPVAAPEAA